VKECNSNILGDGLPQRLYLRLYRANVTTVRGVKEQRIILHEISKRKANCIVHILCRNCLVQQVIEGKVKGGI
jgi:phosphoribosylformylglycinamidine (FGAM) synthase PurS component